MSTDSVVNGQCMRGATCQHESAPRQPRPGLGNGAIFATATKVRIGLARYACRGAPSRCQLEPITDSSSRPGRCGASPRAARSEPGWSTPPAMCTPAEAAALRKHVDRYEVRCRLAPATRAPPEAPEKVPMPRPASPAASGTRARGTNSVCALRARLVPVTPGAPRPPLAPGPEARYRRGPQARPPAAHARSGPRGVTGAVRALTNVRALEARSHARAHAAPEASVARKRDPRELRPRARRAARRAIKAERRARLAAISSVSCLLPRARWTPAGTAV